VGADQRPERRLAVSTLRYLSKMRRHSKACDPIQQAEALTHVERIGATVTAHFRRSDHHKPSHLQIKIDGQRRMI